MSYNKNFTTLTPLGAESTAVWGDVDNDGYLDILLSGTLGLSGDPHRNKIYLNNQNNSFSEYYSTTPSDDFSDLVDIDNDGDLDIVTEGRYLTVGKEVYINNLGYNLYRSNTSPNPPTNPCSYFVKDGIVMTWAPGSDEETPEQSLSYNVYLKQNGNMVLSPMSDLVTGYRKIPARGNADLNTSWFIKIPSSTGTIEWGVQTIENQYKGSLFTAKISDPKTLLCGLLTSDSHWGRNIYVSDNTQGCVQPTSVQSGNTVNLTASNNIFLKPGLIVSEGSFLIAKIGAPSEGNNPCKTINGGRIATGGSASPNVKSDSKEEVYNISIYPNPSNEVFTFEAVFENIKDIEYAVYSSTGMEILRKRLGPGILFHDELTLTQFPPGLYFLKATWNENYQVIKIIKTD